MENSSVTDLASCYNLKTLNLAITYPIDVAKGRNAKALIRYAKLFFVIVKFIYI